ncbi:UNVERIFIED_CONTAM: phosphopantetheinyl transferase [Acetivibrio alkalicellulosi]
MANTEQLLKKNLNQLSSKFNLEYFIVNMKEISNMFEFEQQRLYALLSNSELEYLEQLKIYKNKVQWVSGRYVVKQAFFKYKLSSKSLIDLSCIDVVKGQNSEPYILQYPNVNVSITHSYPYCIGIVSEKNIGIDLEKINAPEDSLIKFFFSEREKEILIDINDSNQYNIKSINLWTRKEAVSKLLKLGMKMNFKKLDVIDDELICNGVIKLFTYVCNDFSLTLAIDS